MSELAQVARTALLLGLTSFGGPIAHLAYYHREYVERRRWLGETMYADLVALCQFLPGPASSQIGIAVGTLRAGGLGGIVAWLGFTLPSAIALVLFAQLTTTLDLASIGWIHGLKLAAVAIVAQAVVTMWRALAADVPRSAIVVAAAAAALASPLPFTQVALIAAGAVVGRLFLDGPAATGADDMRSPISKRTGVALLAVFVTLLVGLPTLAALSRDATLAMAEAFYRAGALVFGGGHVVLPLLYASVVPSGWVSDEAFLAGYGAAQAVPGPLFTFAAYLGTVMNVPPGGALGGAIALGAIFLPAFLLIWGAMPFWHDLRRDASFRRALTGTNAAVVGILLAALYRPIWASAVTSVPDAAVAVAVFTLLAGPRIPPWAAVLISAAAGEALSLVGPPGSASTGVPL